mmetsp:Transcript_28396/g.62179  ORF Transcript_28396/g.62179 Transcript_28396/m.62179 type:complete len:322 (-) Transcript_28396:31-996(-)
MSLLSSFSRNSGKASSRSVCPVGAVSKITRSYEALPSFPFSRTRASTSERASSSSSPGGVLSRISANSSRPSCETTSSAMPPRPRSAARKPPTASRKRATASAVSTSIASKLASPDTSTGLPPETSSMSASLNECAGSVDTISVEKPASAQRVAIAEDVDVLPTPPLPPTKTSFCFTFSSRVRSALSGLVSWAEGGEEATEHCTVARRRGVCPRKVRCCALVSHGWEETRAFTACATGAPKRLLCAPIINAAGVSASEHGVTSMMESTKSAIVADIAWSSQPFSKKRVRWLPNSNRSYSARETSEDHYDSAPLLAKKSECF